MRYIAIAIFVFFCIVMAYPTVVSLGKKIAKYFKQASK